MLIIVAQACTYTSIPEVPDLTVESGPMEYTLDVFEHEGCPDDLSYEIETSESATGTVTLVWDGFDLTMTITNGSDSVSAAGFAVAIKHVSQGKVYAYTVFLVYATDDQEASDPTLADLCSAFCYITSMAQEQATQTYHYTDV